MTAAGAELLANAHRLLDLVEPELVSSLAHHLELHPSDPMMSEDPQDNTVIEKLLEELGDAICLSATGAAKANPKDVDENEAVQEEEDPDEDDGLMPWEATRKAPPCNIDHADYKMLQQRLLSVTSRCPGFTTMELAAECLWATFDHLMRAGNVRIEAIPGDTSDLEAEANKRALSLWHDTLSLILKTMSARSSGPDSRRAVFSCVVLLSKIGGMSQTFFTDPCGDGMKEYHDSIGKTMYMVLRDAGGGRKSAAHAKDPLLALCAFEYFMQYLSPIDPTGCLDDDMNDMDEDGNPIDVTLVRKYYDPALKLGIQTLAKLATPLGEEIQKSLLCRHDARGIFFYPCSVDMCFMGFLRDALTEFSNLDDEWYDDLDFFSEVLKCSLHVLKKSDPELQTTPPRGFCRTDTERSVSLASAMMSEICTLADKAPVVFRKKIPSSFHTDLLLHIYEYMRHPFVEDDWGHSESLLYNNSEQNPLPETAGGAIDSIAKVLHGKTVQAILGPMMQAAMGGGATEGAAASSTKKKSSTSAHKKRSASVSVCSAAGGGQVCWEDKHAAVMALTYLGESCSDYYKKNMVSIVNTCLKWLDPTEHQYLRFASASSVGQLCQEFTVTCRRQAWKPIYLACRTALLGLKPDENPTLEVRLASTISLLFSEGSGNEEDDDAEISSKEEKKIRRELLQLEVTAGESAGKHVDPNAPASTGVITHLARLFGTTSHRYVKQEILNTFKHLFTYLGDLAAPFLPDVMAALWAEVIKPYLAPVVVDLGSCPRRKIPMLPSQDLGAFHHLRNRCFESFGIIAEAVEGEIFSPYTAQVCKGLFEFYDGIGDTVKSIETLQVIEKAEKEEREAAKAKEGAESSSTSSSPSWEKIDVAFTAVSIEDQATRIVVDSWSHLVESLGSGIQPYLERLMNVVLAVAQTPCDIEVLPTPVAGASKCEPGKAIIDKDGAYSHLSYWRRSNLTSVQVSVTKQRMSQEALNMVAKILQNEYVRTNEEMPRWRQIAMDVVMSVLESAEGEDADIRQLLALMALSNPEDLPDYMEQLETCAMAITGCFDSFDTQGTLASLKEELTRGEKFDEAQIEAQCLHNQEEKVALLNRIFKPLVQSMPLAHAQMMQVNEGDGLVGAANAYGEMWNALKKGLQVCHKSAFSLDSPQVDVPMALLVEKWQRCFNEVFQKLEGLRQEADYCAEQEEYEDNAELYQSFEVALFTLDTCMEFAWTALEKMECKTVAPATPANPFGFAGGFGGFGFGGPTAIPEDMTSVVRALWYAQGTKLLSMPAGIANSAVMLFGKYVEQQCPQHEEFILHMFSVFSQVALSEVEIGQTEPSQRSASYHLGVVLETLREANDALMSAEPTETKTSDQDEPVFVGSKVMYRKSPARASEQLGHACQKFLVTCETFFKQTTPCRWDDGPLQAQKDRIHPELCATIFVTTQVPTTGGETASDSSGEFEDIEDGDDDEDGGEEWASATDDSCTSSADGSKEEDDNDDEGDLKDDKDDLRWDKKLTGDGEVDQAKHRIMRLDTESNFLSAMVKYFPALESAQDILLCDLESKFSFPHHDEWVTRMQRFLPLRGTDLQETKFVHRCLLLDYVLPVLLPECEQETFASKFATSRKYAASGLEKRITQGSACLLLAGIVRSNPKYLCAVSLEALRVFEAVLLSHIGIGMKKAADLRNEEIQASAAKLLENNLKLKKKQQGAKLAIGKKKVGKR